MRKIEVTPVFTAHPTEVARRTVLAASVAASPTFSKISTVCRFPSSTPTQYESAILAEITALWQTDEVRLKKPSVTDEVRMGLDPYPMTLFDTVPQSLCRDG